MNKRRFLRKNNGVTHWSAVEPIISEFECAVPIQNSTAKNLANASTLKGNFPSEKSEIIACVRQLVDAENLPLQPVSKRLGISLTTVRRICRTLKIGSYREKGKTGVRSYSSQVPFGWKFNQGFLEKDQTEWALVLRMAKFKARGKSFQFIARYLSDEGIRTKNGGKWHAKTVIQILSFNEPHLKKK